MAETTATAATATSTTTTTTNGRLQAPIINLASDHLFTILLLLPVDSILSFSMTCKRFKTLASSDTLWEAVCRREWGPASVDALKSSLSSSSLSTSEGHDCLRERILWMKLFERVCRLDSVSCHKISDPDRGLVLPSPRASHSLNFLSDCLVLFGGGCEGGRHLDDTWVAYVGRSSNQKLLKWKKVDSGTPSGRFGHTCVAMGNQLLLFGGINDRGDRHNDTWIGEVAFREDLSWKLLDVESLAPSPRGAHAACCIGSRKMVIHGGIGLHGVRLGDTWILELSENLCLGRWHELVFHPSPPPRSGHTLTCIRENQAVLFGGRGLGYDVLNDVWLLDVRENYERWTQILYDFQNIPESASLPRVGHSATLILGGRLLIYGGEDSYRHRKDDFWVLDVNAIPSTGSQAPTLTLKQASAWRRLNGVRYKPNCRSFHRACLDHSGRCVYVFGGMVDGLIQSAASSGLRFDGELFMVELVLDR